MIVPAASTRRPARAVPERSVLVVDAGFLPTTRRMAAAVAGDVRAYVTPIATRRRGALTRVPLAGNEVTRRTLPSEIAARVRRAGSGIEATRLMLGRARVRRFEYDLLWRRNIAVDRAAAALVTANSTVIGQYGACAATLERARDLGATTMLDYPIAREQAVRAILDEERALRPDFADTIAGPATVTRREHLARLDREIAFADRILVGSAFAASSFAGVVDDARVRVVPYGVDTRLFAPPPARSMRKRGAPLRVLFAGQITQRKGIGYLLDAMRLLDPAKFTLTLAGAIAGSGAGLRTYAGLFAHVDALAPSAMPRLFGDADVLVLPSLAEGSALVVLEAMASGIPAIVTANTGADALRDGVEGFVVPLRSPGAIAERLSQLEADEDLRLRMGDAARARALQFGWQHFSAAFRDAIGFGDVADDEAGA